MPVLRALLGAVLGCSLALLGATPALAATYTVASTDDPASPPACTATGGGTFSCPSLRAAVSDANQLSPGADAVVLGTGTYQLALGPLQLDDAVTIAGAGARSTTIRGDGNQRVLEVSPSVSASVLGVTIANGAVADEDGANVRNYGSLTLSEVRVTGGQAVDGGGISNDGGTLVIANSLIDGNTALLSGGAISSVGGSSAAALQVSDTTITGNTASNGGGVAVRGSFANTTRLTHVTIARNLDGGGIFLTDDAGDARVYGSIVAYNAPSNCVSGTKPTDAGYNADTGTGCGLGGTGSVQAVDPQLGGLANLGGQTDVLPIAATSPAANLVAACQTLTDQRRIARVASALEACDAGAYEIADVTPPPPPPPAPTPAPTATPVPGKAVAGDVVEGTVLVKTPGGKFLPLDPSKPIPNGSEIDTKNGKIEITAQQKKGGALQRATFSDGIFKVTQTKKTTDLTLTEPLAACGKHASAAAKRKKKAETRKLWGDGSGSFRTRGQYSAATVRGTRWLVQDSCAGTLTKVAKGVVSVRDLVKRRTIVLRAGKHYLAKPRR